MAVAIRLPWTVRNRIRIEVMQRAVNKTTRAPKDIEQCEHCFQYVIKNEDTKRFEHLQPAPEHCWGVHGVKTYD